MTFCQIGGGGLGEYKKSLSENTKTFLTRGGGSYPIQKGFFGIIYQKRGFFIKKIGIFFTKGGGSRPIQKILIRKYSDFFLLRGGGLAQSKKSLSEKTEVVKKGGGGGGV